MVKNIVYIVVIIFFWFILGSTLTFMALDPVLQSPTLQGNFSFSSINTSNINITNPISSGDSPKNALSMVVNMFTFRIPENVLPPVLNIFVSFLNIILLFVVILLIYRLALPTSGE